MPIHQDHTGCLKVALLSPQEAYDAGGRWQLVQPLHVACRQVFGRLSSDAHACISMCMGTHAMECVQQQM